MEIARYLGYFAGALTVASYLPQVARTWRTRETKDLSLGMLITLVAASSAWIAYGVIASAMPVILTNVGMLILSSAILVAKLKFK